MSGILGFPDLPDICSFNRYLLDIYCMPEAMLASVFGDRRFKHFIFLSILPCQIEVDEFELPGKCIPSMLHSYIWKLNGGRNRDGPFKNLLLFPDYKSNIFMTTKKCLLQIKRKNTI